MQGRSLPDRRDSRPLSAAGLWLRFAIALICAACCAVPARAGQQSAQASGQAAAAGRPAGAASLPAEAPPFLITGVVIDSATKAPVPHAALTIEPMTTVRKAAAPGISRRPRRRPQTQSATASAIADSTGHFELEAPSAGGWALIARARGYAPSALDEHEGYSTAVVLTEASPKAEVTFRLTPASVIEGYVYDEAGEPVRDAQVALSFIAPPTPENQHPKPQVRAQQTTDDRGFYRFSGNAPGSYQIRVTAHPWYATTAQHSIINGPDGDEAAPAGNQGPDPLDVVYPTVWYPGVTDPAAATAIVLHGGETQEANLRLLPVPGFHLLVRQTAGQGQAAPAVETDNRDGPRNLPMFTFAMRVMPDGTEEPATSFSTVDAQGNTDIGGLVPGNYIIHQQSPTSQTASLATLEIGPNSARTIDFANAVPATTVALQLDPPTESDSIQIAFKDVETGHMSYAERAQEPGRGPEQRIRRRQQADAPAADKAAHADRTVELAPGKYEVSLNGQGDLHLAAIEAAGATAAGRTVTIDGGSPKLMLHTAHGRGVVSGTVSFHGNPDPGAMVLLIPATLGDPGGIDLPGRDQSNSDGSFEIGGVLPGGYILVAIDHGWDVNWSDPATLRRYLMHGTALEIKPSSDLKERIEAVAP